MFEYVKKDLLWVWERGKVVAVLLTLSKWVAGFAAWLLFIAYVPTVVVFVVLGLIALGVFVMVSIAAVQDKLQKAENAAWQISHAVYVATHGHVPNVGELVIPKVDDV